MDSTATSAPTAIGGMSARDQALSCYRPLVEKLVAALGALVTHQLAYLAASVLAGAVGFETVAASDHSHVSLQMALVTPVALVAVAGFIVWQLRTLGFRSAISARSLGGLVLGFFLIQETIEGLVDGRSLGTIAAHPAIAIGVLLAPLVAWVLSRILTGATELAARLFAIRDAVLNPPASIRLIPVPVRHRSTILRARSRPRAPPYRLRN